MPQFEALTNNENESKNPFLFFSIWSFILLCRPQDYLSFLGKIRPGLTLGLITMLIYFLSVKNSERITNSNQFRLFMYLIIVMIVSVPFSYYMSASLMDVFDYTCITTMFFFLFYNLVNTIEKLGSILFAYCSGVAMYGVYILKFGNYADNRIVFGNMFDPNDIAFFVISFIAFNLLFIAKHNKGYIRAFSVINILLGLTVILKTGSRGGLVATVIVLSYLLFAKTRTVKVSFMTKVVVVMVALTSLQFVAIDTERYKTILNLQDDYNVTGEEGRIAIWKAGMRMMLSRPLTGVGMNRFSEGVGRDREERGLGSAKWQTAHNSMVQIGAETGIFGLILFCLMSFNIFKITGQIIRKSRSEALIKVSEMTRAGFLGHFISAMFLSQAYSVYWAFYIVLSAVLHRMHDLEEA